LSTELSTKEKWLMAIICAAPHVHGDTRLQKYSLLVSKQILKGPEFFNDWKASNFGGYSSGVTICVNKLVKDGYLDVREFTYEQDKKVRQYTVSQKGKSIVEDFLKTQLEIFEKIKHIVTYYHPKKLMDLLNNVYALYPDLTVNSKIKSEVNKSIVQNNTNLSPEFEIAIEEERYVQVPSPSSGEHVFGDEYFREKLAKSIGLKYVPKLDSKAFERLSGIISSKIKTDDFDSVDLVKTVRGC
jgi:hypothetical protein